MKGIVNFLLLMFIIAGLFSCEPDDRLTGVAAGAKGQYVVTAYIVAGDTLFSVQPGYLGSKPEINKIGVDNFTIAIDTRAADQSVLITSFRRNGARSSFSKDVSVKLTNYSYQFSLVENTNNSAYDGHVGRFNRFFYERTAGESLLIPLANSSAAINASSSQEVVIIAQRTD